MANKKITNIFDSALQMTVDTEQKYMAGDETCFTDNKILANVKTQVAAMVPEAELNVSTTVYNWTQVFCFDVEYRLTYKNIYGNKQGFSIKLTYERTTNECDKYTISLVAEHPRSTYWDALPMPNKAKAFRGKAVPSSSDKSMTFIDPPAELVRDFVNALVTPNRRKALREYIDNAKAAAMESANTKNMLDIESIDILPEIEQITRKFYMGIPEVIDKPNQRRIRLLLGQYSCSLELVMYKNFMEFGIHSGSDYNSDDFVTNFIRLLKCSLASYKIDIGTQIGYDQKELVFDMVRRIGECYKAVYMSMGFETWRGVDKKWKMNPDNEQEILIEI